MAILGKQAEYIFALMRFVTGFLFACHGADKLFGAFGGHQATGNTLLMVAAVIELVGGALVALGLFTSPAAFLCSGEMAVAYFKQHSSASLWPIVNKGELAVLLCFVFLYIAAHGSGALGLDSTVRRRRF